MYYNELYYICIASYEPTYDLSPTHKPTHHIIYIQNTCRVDIIVIDTDLQLPNNVHTITMIMVIHDGMSINNISSPRCQSAIGLPPSPRQSCTNPVPGCQSGPVRGARVFSRKTPGIWPHRWA